MYGRLCVLAPPPLLSLPSLLQRFFSSLPAASAGRRPGRQQLQPQQRSEKPKEKKKLMKRQHRARKTTEIWPFLSRAGWGQSQERQTDRALEGVDGEQKRGRRDVFRVGSSATSFHDLQSQFYKLQCNPAERNTAHFPA